MNHSRGSKPIGRKNNVEAQISKPDDIGLPRLIARIWGLVSGISYISNGGYLMTQMSDHPKCQGAGCYMIIFGISIIIQEFACCFCPTKGNCCDKFEEKFPFWARSIFYFLSVIPPLALCFGAKTIISSIIVIMLGLLYAFIFCLARSKKYERLREASRVELQRRKNEAAGYGSLLSTANNAMTFIKKTTTAAKQQHPVRVKGAPRTAPRGKNRSSTASC